MTQISNGVASFVRGQEKVQFRQSLLYDSKIQVYQDFEAHFEVKNMRTNKTIGQIDLNLAKYVNVKEFQLNLSLESSLGKLIESSAKKLFINVEDSDDEQNNRQSDLEESKGSVSRRQQQEQRNPQTPQRSQESSIKYLTLQIIIRSQLDLKSRGNLTGSVQRTRTMSLPTKQRLETSLKQLLDQKTLSNGQQKEENKSANQGSNQVTSTQLRRTKSVTGIKALDALYTAKAACITERVKTHSKVVRQTQKLEARQAVAFENFRDQKKIVDEL